MENKSNQTENTDACPVLQFLSIYCAALFILSITVNSITVWVLIKNTKVLQHESKLLIALAMLNIFGTLFELPVIGISAFKCQYVKI